MLRIRVWMYIGVLLLAALPTISAQQAVPSANATVPPLVNFSGSLTDNNGKPLSGIVGVTFSLYTEEQGGSPLWIETQNVQPDKNGHYTVQLGAFSSQGLPNDLFSSGEARWLGVQAEGQVEQPRVMLLSVPYAMKAADAATIGGLPPSAFVMANSPGNRSAGGRGKAAPGTETQNFIPIFIDNSGDLGNSILFQAGTTEVGIGTTSPSATLEVNGTAKFDNLVNFASGQTFPGTLTGITPGTGINITGSKTNPTVGINTTFANQFYAQLKNPNTFTANQTVNGTMTATNFSGSGSSLTNVNALLLNGLSSSAFSQLGASNLYQSSPLGTAIPQVLASVNNATTSSGFNSNPLDLAASSYNSSANAAQKQTFRWQGEPTGNNTSSPSGTLNLLFGANGAPPAETGLNIASNGQITFASGQTFPGTGSGTITGITAGAGLAGGGTSGNVSVNIAGNGVTNAMLQNSALSVNAGNGLTGGGAVSLGGSTALAVDTTKVVTAVVAGTDLTGGGAGGVQTLNLDTTKVPQLGTGNNFNGNQNVTGNVIASGTVSGANINSSGTFSVGGVPFLVGSASNADVFLGFAGNSSLSGGANTGVGFSSLSSLTSGQFNSAVGESSLQNNTTGFYNTATGYQALFANISGSENVAVGQASLIANTTGGANVAVGQAAMPFNTVGSSNVALGVESLYANTSGAYNTAAGIFSLALNTTGANNTAIGDYALPNNTTGNGNTALGTVAGQIGGNGTATGSLNTFLGSYTSSGGQTALNNATAVGASAQVTQSNSLVLGSINGVNGATASTNVGIGTTAPISALEIDSATPANLVGPTITMTNTSGNGQISLDFNTYPPSGQGIYNPASRMQVGDYGGYTDVIAFLANRQGQPNNGLQTTMSIDPFGNVHVYGNLSKGGGSFKIDHPLDPANKYLYHSFVESPDMMNIYNGVVTLNAQGFAWVTLPDYFEALNQDFRYQLTSIGRAQPNLYIGREISGHRFKISGGKAGGKVSWQVTGIRHDAYANAHRIPVEEDKPLQEQGHYLHPELFGAPAELAIGSRPAVASQSPALASRTERSITAERQ